MLGWFEKIYWFAIVGSMPSLCRVDCSLVINAELSWVGSSH